MFLNLCTLFPQLMGTVTEPHLHVLRLGLPKSVQAGAGPFVLSKGSLHGGEHA